MSEKKINIASLLEQNNIQLNTGGREKETDFEKKIDNTPEGFDPSQVEGAGTISGVTLENDELLNKNTGVKGGGVSRNIISNEQMKFIEETLKEIDEETELAKAEFEKFQNEQQQKRLVEGAVDDNRRNVGENESLSEEVTSDLIDIEDSVTDYSQSRAEFNKKYEEAVVIIDKTGMGHIDFTPEEREKLQKVKSIKLKEVETIELKSIKTKKAKVGVADRILQKRNTIRNTTVVLPISGITVVMTGCSTFELMGLITGDSVDVMALVSKWTLIHSKVETTSIGKLNFNDFLNSVSSMEYDMLVYGILCATFPEEDTFPLTCPKCRTSIEHKYIVRSLLRAEEMSDKLAEKVKEVADCSYTENMAKECFENSILNTEITIKLPMSDFICTLGVQNAYSFIYDSVNAIDKMDEKYQQAIILSSAIPTIFVPNPDDGGESYLEISDTEDKIKLIYSLEARDISILTNKIGTMTEGMQFKFGLMDITCPNAKCRHHVNSIEVDLETILFHKYQQAMNTSID